MIGTTTAGYEKPTHGPGDPVVAVGTKTTWHELYVSYRLHLHQHPFVRELGQKLVREGVDGLQAADTQYGSGSLPGAVKVRLLAGLRGTAGAGSLIGLTGELRCPGGVTLDADQLFALVADAVVTLPAEVKLLLLDGKDPCPDRGATLPLTAAARVLLVGDVETTLAADSTVELQIGYGTVAPPGTRVVIPGGTRVVLTADTLVRLAEPGSAEVVRAVHVPRLYAEFLGAYGPDETMVRQPYPVKDLDFGTGGAYAVYNWELFYHVPLMLAVHLSKNQRFAEAQRWLHYLFDPTDDSGGPEPQRYWKVRPFHGTDVARIEDVLVNLVTREDRDLRQATLDGIKRWQADPFRPHAVARYRHQAYMWKTVMTYLDNLIDWGDSLFRQDTGEAVDEALQLYVLAANILGPRPQPLPRRGRVRPQTYANLRQDLAAFGTVLRDVEADVPVDEAPPPVADGEGDAGLSTLASIAKALYFHVPPNEKLLGYWDTVADRLFKIRNSLNLQGVFRQLPLFEPPIDPALLARAAAAGLDVGAIVNGLNQPLPLVRFQLLAQKAAEIAQEVKSLGASLLSAMEKEDGEALAILRARHERAVLELVEGVKYAQLQEAGKAREGLQQALALAVHRYTYYERQLGRSEEDIQKALPTFSELDRDALDRMKLAAEEPSMPLRGIEVDIATDTPARIAQTFSGGKLLSSHEVEESLLLEGGQLASDIANGLSIASSIAHAVPTFKLHVQPWGFGSTIEYGGVNVGNALAAVSTGARAVAERLNFEARRAARIDAFSRRERDWAYQSNLAAGEIVQIFKQVRAAELREAVAEQELKSHQKQMAHAKELERFLNRDGADRKGKRTNQALYAWIKREVKGLYGHAFQFAFDVARKAERALQRELGDPSLGFLQFTYLGGKEGLLAGEKLYLDVKRMEMAYHELNEREYELTKHVSLLQVDPMALVQLRTTGQCTVALPETLFDLDGPGHYFRRIKTVSLSVPCVAGPFATVNCTLTLLKSSIRTTPAAGESGYARTGAEDARFDDSYGRIESIVASSGQSDSGLFETNLRDERYLPFEGSGAISEWQLRLPANPSCGEPALFDYATISDVILHVRYTAREGGQVLRGLAIAALTDPERGPALAGTTRLFSVRQEFPTEWARFRAESADPIQLTLQLRPEHYPYWSKDRLGKVVRVDVLARSAETRPVTFRLASEAPGLTTMTKTASFGGLLYGPLSFTAPKDPDAWELDLLFSTRALSDLWIAVKWGGTGP